MLPVIPIDANILYTQPKHSKDGEKIFYFMVSIGNNTNLKPITNSIVQQNLQNLMTYASDDGIHDRS